MENFNPHTGNVTLPPLRLSPPHITNRADAPTMLSVVARLIASGMADSKTAITAATGLSRATASSYVDTLIRRGLVEQLGTISSDSRGRPALKLGLSPKAGVILIVDIGAQHTHLAITNLSQQILAHKFVRMNVRQGPQQTLVQIEELARELLASHAPGLRLNCIVVGLPARIDNQSGIPVRPGIMPGWDGYPVRNWAEQAFNCPVVQENDANMRAIGESAALPEDQLPLLVLKVGTGIGAGLIDDSGDVYHGFDGAAGEVGHIPVRGTPDVLCTCGTTGCVEAIASVPSIIAQIKQADPSLFRPDVDELDTLLTLLRKGNLVAVQTVRSAAEYLGEAVAILCNVLNPRRIVIGGEMSNATDELLAGIRAVTYQNARPLATRNLVIRHSVIGEFAGIAGGVVLGIEAALSPEALRRR